MVDERRPGTAMRLAADADHPAGWLLQGDSQQIDGGTVWEAIRSTLDSDPAAPCLSCGEVMLTRGELRAEVERVAAELQGLRVGLHVPRSIASVVITLAVWRNSGAYVPISREYPHARVQGMADGCTLDLIVADHRLVLAGYAGARACVLPGIFIHDRIAGVMPNPDGDALCAIVHTSGSTGSPKGVKISHANLLNRLACMRGFLDLQPGDCILYKTSPVFDVHIWEFTLPLVAGCRMVIYPQTRLFDLPQVARIMVQQSVTVVGFVPALLRLLLDMPDFVAGNRLRALLCGGEAWGAALARDFYARLPGRRLYNSYGPAETTIAVANWPVPDDPGLDTILLGRPLPNTVFLIEDEQPPAITEGQSSGTLLIGGAQVALGYVEPRGGERFAERVIGGRPMRFYATGDRVRLDHANGTVVFKGRTDQQVKVNGMRIELEEIEEAVRSLDLVENCVAFVANAGRFPQLCVAYKSRGDAVLQAADIRRACTGLLPAGFIPSRLTQVASIPLSPSGKVDRAAIMHTQANALPS